MDEPSERRVNWARTMADIAVIKEMQIQQTATLAKLEGRVDLLWDANQRSEGASLSQNRSNVRWRWILGIALTLMGLAFTYRSLFH
jgi:hypothetical protein